MTLRLSKWMLSAMVAILIMSFGVGNPQVFASSLKDMKDEKNALEEKKKSLNSDLEMKKSKITTNQTEVDRIQAEINKLNNEVATTNEKIMVLQNEIVKTIEEIDALQVSIVDLENKIQERDEVLRERARAMQANGGSVSYIDVLLGANSFADFIDRISAVNTLVDADREIMQRQADDQKQLEEEKKLVEQKLAGLETDKSKLEELKASLQAQKAEQDRLVEQLNKELDKLNVEKSSLETDLHEVYEVSAELTKEIEAEEGRLAELARQAEIERQKRLAEEASANKGGQSSSGNASSGGSSAAVSDGTWTRPTTGRVTSEFGRRSVSLGSSNHRGIDIANPVGTTVVAAGDGVVGRAGPMSTLGNVVMITHSVNGKIYTTLYAHLSTVNVSAGQRVTKGQAIGRIGMTGRTSGPHLHFELHVGGWSGSGPSAVNPRSQVPI